MKMSPFFVQLGRIVVGYIAAALAFGLFYSISIVVLDVAPTLADIMLLIVFAAVFASIFAIPVALPLIIFSEWRCWRHWGVFVGAGTILGGLMLAIMFNFGQTDNSIAFGMFLLMVAGCAASGITYWAIAGRHAGGWRVSPPSQ